MFPMRSTYMCNTYEDFENDKNGCVKYPHRK